MACAAPLTSENTLFMCLLDLSFDCKLGTQMKVSKVKGHRDMILEIDKA